MRLSGSSPLGRRSTHTPRHLPNPRTAGRGVTQSRGRVYYHYSSGRVTSHRVPYSHQNWLARRNAAVAAHKRARARQQAKKSRFVSERTSLAQATARRTLAEVQARGGGLRPKPVHFLSPFAMDPLGGLKYQIKWRGDVAKRAAAQATSRAAYARSARAQARALWRVVHRDYGGRRPRVAVGAPPRGLRAAGWVNAGQHPHSVTHLAAEYAAAAAGVNPHARATLQRILLHEWAHNRQPVGFRRRAPQIFVEGGAEAFSRYVAKKHHIGGGRLGTRPWAYEDYVRRVREHQGPSFIRRGQFGRH